MNILLVDDHPMTSEGYKSSIQKAYRKEHLFEIAYDCEEAYNLVCNKTSAVYDIAILDHSLPPYAEKELYSGCDLAIFIKGFFPSCKIVIITAHTEVIIVYDIYKRARPDALIIKTDITPVNLPEIINEISLGGHYLSPTAAKCIRDIWRKDLMIEDFNRQILYYLSKGYKIRELAAIVPLSPSTIQRRVINMKKAFDVTDDNSLVKEAIIQGFI